MDEESQDQPDKSHIFYPRLVNDDVNHKRHLYLFANQGHLNVPGAGQQRLDTLSPFTTTVSASFTPPYDINYSVVLNRPPMGNLPQEIRNLQNTDNEDVTSFFHDDKVAEFDIKGPVNAIKLKEEDDAREWFRHFTWDLAFVHQENEDKTVHVLDAPASKS